MKTVTLDGAVLAAKEALHQTLAQTLAFPDWYGGNLDALFDCLTDLSEEVSITLLNWDGLGDYGQRVKKVLLAAARENDRITLQVI
ncbi:barstar family protein [Evtepia sp.]|uniref:barstar family protein n=1 Tax=Evtepia sp. TaxID=2773933 RepID=UPI002A8211B4|nr:barstar family protein [Evtepia sp.]MDY4430073.1 barstar family protein [Evtepia sp.]